MAVRREHWYVEVEPAIIKAAGPSALVTIVLGSLVVLACIVAVLAVFRLPRPNRPPNPTGAPATSELIHRWGGATATSLNVIGSGFWSGEQVSLFAAPTAAAGITPTLVSITITLAADDGSIVVNNIDLGPRIGQVNGLQLQGRGLTSGILVKNDVLVVPTPIPTATPVPDNILAPIPATATPVPAGPWRAQYFANRDLFPPVVLEEYVPDVFFYWGSGSPAPGLVPANYFSARYTRTLSVSAPANYVFKLVVAGAARVFINDVVVIDQWFLGKQRTAIGNFALVPGTYVIRVEYYADKGNATLCLTWQSGFTGWAGRYYNNPGWQPPAVVLSNTLNIDYNWGDVPVATVVPDGFSADWERNVYFYPGQYEFTLYADDFARVFINGKEVQQLTRTDGPGESTHRMRLSGWRFIQVQFREDSGAAIIRFDWQLITHVPTRVPKFSTPCPSGGC